jgi:hypothetical protein
MIEPTVQKIYAQLKPDLPHGGAPENPESLMPLELHADMSFSAFFIPHSGQVILLESVNAEKTSSSNL